MFLGENFAFELISFRQSNVRVANVGEFLARDLFVKKGDNC